MEKNSNGLEIASITLGTLSMIFFVFIYIWIPTGILAIIYGKKAKRGKSGIVTGIVGMSICIAFYATMITLFATGVLHI